MSGMNLTQLSQESQSMVNSISKEVSESTGYPVKYIKRELISVDTIFNDVKQSTFTEYYDTSMVVEVDESSLGEQDYLSKFGIEIKNQISFSINKETWSELTTGLLRPREGDLIYLEMSDRLWEITYVDNFREKKLTDWDYMSHHITCEVFDYNQEDIDLDTGIDTIDKFDEDNRYSIDITLGSGSGTFVKDEIVYQGPNLNESTARAIVLGWNEETKVLRIFDLVGNFAANQMLIGNMSESAYLLGATTVLSTPSDIVSHFSNDDFAMNTEIEIEAEKIIDWTEEDPFSEGDY